MSVFVEIRTRHVEDIMGEFYREEIGPTPEHGREQIVVLADILADIRHYCDTHHVPFTQVQEKSFHIYARELLP